MLASPEVGHWSIEPPHDHPYRIGSFAWWFTDRTTGRTTIAQRPNLTLSVFVVAAVASRLLDAHHQLSHVLSIVGTVALALWAGDEVVRGVNPWRRTLGSGVLLWQAVSLLSGWL